MELAKIKALPRKKYYEAGVLATLFLLSFIGFLCWIIPKESMVNISGDAADIWKAITTLHTGEMQFSYVLYKGIMSVYPYTWLYRLSLVFHTDAFLFIKVYHAVLFCYVAVIGIPQLIKDLLHTKPLLWQRVALIVFLFFTWSATGALDQLMVDLPSCAFFIAAANVAFLTVRATGYKRILFGASTGLFTGLCANISGQYSLAALLLIVYVAIKLFNKETRSDKTRLLISLSTLSLLFVVFFLPKFSNFLFTVRVIEPMLARTGAYLSNNTFWMQRGLIYMLSIGRNFVGFVATPRGYAMLEDYYGAELAKELFEKAAAGTYGWTIPEYFRFILHYPAETVAQLFDRGFLALTTDQGNASFLFLFLGYSFLYLAFLTAIRHNKRIKDFFRLELLIILSVCASIVPLLVLTVEMRCAIAFQGVVLGIGLAGPILPEIYARIKETFLKLKHKEIKLSELPFPWELLIYFVFMAVCFTHISTLYSTGNAASALFTY